VGESLWGVSHSLSTIGLAEHEVVFSFLQSSTIFVYHLHCTIAYVGLTARLTTNVIILPRRVCHKFRFTTNNRAFRSRDNITVSTAQSRPNYPKGSGRNSRTPTNATSTFVEGQMRITVICNAANSIIIMLSICWIEREG